MTGTRPADILRQLEQSGEADAELLARFATAKDTHAFAELVRRHGPLVLGVCRRVTGHRQDAEDAFQATFLVLAKRAALVRNAALLGNWLYGVAFRVAWKAKRSVSRRRAREVAVSVLPEVPAPATTPAMAELTPILDEELAALSAYHRDAILLCDLRGMSRAEAAVTLGIPEGTLSSRLASGRKKLAARLTKRGITLSVAALPAALSEATACGAVPNELLSKTCGLVENFAAGGVVPRPLAKLAEGGFTMRKSLLLAAVLAFALGGAVVAARTNEDAPPADPPKQRAAEVKPEEKEERKDVLTPAPKDGEKWPAPRMRNAVDIAAGGIETIAWSPDGNHLAVQGTTRDMEAEKKFLVQGGGQPPETIEKIHVGRVHLDKKWDPVTYDAKPHPKSESRAIGPLVGFSADSRDLITEIREHQLASGFHQLRYWQLRELTLADVERTVELNPAESYGYAFARDGKTYRTVMFERDSEDKAKHLEVVERETQTAKELKSLLKVSDPAEYAMSANGKRFAVFSDNSTKVTVYDLDRGTKLFECALKAKVPEGWNLQPSLAFSANGKRLFVTRSVPGESIILNADNGEPLPTLDGAKDVTLHHGYATTYNGRLFYDGQYAFTSDGRLFAAQGTKEKDGVVFHFLAVWDTQTGKLVKRWPNCTGKFAFNPVKPVLALFEPNGENVTRVGFWDFSPEVEKK